MDDPIPIEGIIEGEPEALASVCAAGGSAVIAYCAAVGAQVYVAETVVAALGGFRRGVVETGEADREPAKLQGLLLAVTDSAVRLVAGVTPSPSQRTAAQAALESAVTGALAPGLAPRIISALVQAAPVTALGGDAAAVRRAAEQHYLRMYDRAQPEAASAALAGRVPSAARAAGGTTADPPAAAAEWVPPELVDVGEQAAADVPLTTSSAQWRSPVELGELTSPDAPAAHEAGPAQGSAPEHPEQAPEPEHELPAGAVPPPAPAPPGALVIKRGGHWPFRRNPGKPAHGASAVAAGVTRNVLLAGLAGLAIGAAVATVAAPEKTVRQNPILVRPLDTPFTVQGAVFNVARTGTAQWARVIRRRTPRAGRAWLTLAAQTRNISRPNFRPRGLGYRLRTPAGLSIGPDTALVAGEIPAVGGRLPTGKRTSVHLGFQVPRGQRGLTLEFDPAAGAPRIRVPLN